LVRRAIEVYKFGYLTMAKSFTWSADIPAGSEQASTADDHIRRLRLEIGERAGDFCNWEDDPVTLRQELIGAQVGKVMPIHCSAFVVEPSEDATFEYGDTGITISNNANPTRTPLILPLGVRLRRIQWLVTNGDTAPLVMKIGSVDFAVGAANSTICTMTTVASGAQIVDSDSSAPFAVVVDSGMLMYLSIDKGSGAEFIIHGARVTYDTPDVRNTL
jgi:alpha-D-ribose 1-methylphosphonate 5-triphosphate synthase subunit PhnH